VRVVTGLLELASAEGKHLLITQKPTYTLTSKGKEETLSGPFLALL